MYSQPVFIILLIIPVFKLSRKQPPVFGCNSLYKNTVSGYRNAGFIIILKIKNKK